MPSDADLRLSSYDFALPEERIAQRPVEPRHAARLLAVDPPGVGPAPHARHLSVWDLQQELRPGDLLVVNDTRVLRARLEARRPTVPGPVLQPIGPAFGQHGRPSRGLGPRNFPVFAWISKKIALCAIQAGSKGGESDPFSA